MPEYIIKEIDVKNPAIGNKVSQLVNEVFHRNTQEDTIFLNTFIQSGKNNSLYLGAFIGDEIVGFNAFISHDFIYTGEIVNCFQSCWAATSPQHRKKGIYYNLKQTAKELLRDRGAAFIFGFPNHNSRPILVKSLGFKVIGALHVINIPNVPLWMDSFFTKWRESDYLLMDDSYLQNDPQLIQLKKKQFGDDIKVFSDYGNMVWGKIRYKKIGGLNIKYFSVGGMIINNPHFFKSCVRKIMTTSKVALIRFIFHSSSYFNKLFTKNKIGIHMDILTIFELKGKHLEKRFNLMFGVKNVF